LEIIAKKRKTERKESGVDYVKRIRSEWKKRDRRLGL